jgi:hypothetical protein
MERAGVPWSVVMKRYWTPHTEKFYAADIVVESDLRAAVQKMEQYQREQEQPRLKRNK